MKRAASVLMSSLVWCAATVAAAPQESGSSGFPSMTPEFLAECGQSAEECRITISAVWLAMMISDPESASQMCVPDAAFAEGNLSDASIAAIVAWIEARPEIGEAGEAIEAAMKALWPITQSCLDEIAARTSDDLPKTTAAFTAYCADEPAGAEKTCDDIISEVAIGEIFRDFSSYCLPDSATVSGESFAAYRGAVKAWLASRPDLAEVPREDSIVAAHKALYPCS